DAPENYHYVSHSVAETEVFQNGQGDETRRTHPITIGICSPIADQIETKFAFGRFDSSVRFAHGRSKGADLHFRIDDWTSLNLLEVLLQNPDPLAHFEHPHHQAVVGVAVFAEWDAEFETRIKSVTIHL